MSGSRAFVLDFYQLSGSLLMERERPAVSIAHVTMLTNNQ
jgi:hypothetical protein